MTEQQPISLPEPHNLEAEQAVLGAMLFDNHVWRDLRDILPAEDFCDPLHQRMMEAIGELVGADGLADANTLTEKLRGSRAFEDLGGVVYLFDMIDRAPPSGHAQTYAAIISDLALKRRLAAIGTVAKLKSLDPEITGYDAIAEVRQTLEAIEHGAAPDDGLFSDARTVGEGLLGKVETELATGRPKGLPCGLECVDKRLGGLLPGSLVIVAGRPGMGKAQPLSSLVLTPRGFMQMGDLSVGDEVCRPNGGTARIESIHPQGEKDVFRLTFADGRSARATGDHLWQVRRRAKWSSIEEVVTTDRIADLLKASRNVGRTSIPLGEPKFDAGRRLPLDPYLLGLLLGDGGLTGATVRFFSKDQELLDAAVAALPSHCYGRQVDEPGRCAAIHVHAKGGRGTRSRFRSALRRLGLLGCGSADKFVPVAYLSASNDARLALLQGLLDTDGTVEPSGTVRFSSVSRALADAVVYLARSLGGTAIVRERQTFVGKRADNRPGQPSYIVTLRHPRAEILFRLERKRRRLPVNYQYRDLRLQIRSVEPDGREPCQCIKLDVEDGLYLTDDFVVTHNTALLGNIMAGAANLNPHVLFAALSLEMDNDQLVERSLSRLTADDLDPIPYERIGKRTVVPTDMRRLHELQQVLPRNLLLRDRAGVGLEEIRRGVWVLKRRGPLGAIAIDYLQLMKQSRRDGRNTAEVIGDTTKGLKNLARDAGIAIVLLSQLSRAVEMRDDKRPQLSDLRDSGSIEQDADAVLFPFREAYYLQKNEPADPSSDAYITWSSEMAKHRDRMDVIIGKNRHGSEGVAVQSYKPELDLITNREHRF